MIEMHHKLTAYRGPHAPLVELFRLCDRIDLSWGLIRSGVSVSYIARVKQAFPNAGFHRRLCYFGWVFSSVIRSILCPCSAGKPPLGG